MCATIVLTIRYHLLHLLHDIIHDANGIVENSSYTLLLPPILPYNVVHHQV